MQKRQWYMDILGSLVIAVLLSGALTMMLAESLQLMPSGLMVYVICIAVTALISTGQISRVAAISASAVAGVGLIIWALSPAKPLLHLAALGQTFADYMSGEQAMLSEHSVPIAALLAILLSLTVYGLVRMGGGVYPAITLSIVIMIASWAMEKRLNAFYVVPVMAALAAMFARAPDDRFPYLKALPMCLVVALLAFMLVPAGNLTWEPLRNSADKIRQLFYDYFLFTDARITYSLYPDGFQPQGEPLGGPANPSDNSVMLVESAEPLLLRGSIKRTYTTYSWTNSSVNNRYLFIDPTKRAVRDQVFDSARLNSLSGQRAFGTVSAKVTMLGNGISTLFAPHRLIELSAGADNAIYYNTNGEVFITRGVEAGDSYQFTALAQMGGTRDMDELAKAAERLQDNQYETVRSEYTTLPHGIEGGVYDMVKDAIKNASTPYRKALYIQQYLMKNFTYSLDVPYPPVNRDFVSFFLLDGKQGYCSYFASAMAVMCRAAGLPARYVEGYMVKRPSADGIVVTGRNAHAWVEVYLNGLGWVTFNPTPGDESDSGESGGSGGGQQEQTDDAGDSEEEIEEEHEPEEELGEEEEQPEDEEQQPEELDEEQQDEGETPDETEAPAEPEPDSEDEGSGGGAGGSLWWLIQLILALAAVGGATYLVYSRLAKSNPAKLEGKAKDADERLAIWYRALLFVLAQQGQVPGAGESPTQFAARLREAGLCGDALVGVANGVEQSRYGGKTLAGSEVKQARVAYERQVKSLKLMERIGWYRGRVFRGIGDTVNIP